MNSLEMFVFGFLVGGLSVVVTLHIATWLMPPNGPSSATASAARVERTVRSRIPATLERTAGRPFAAAHG